MSIKQTSRRARCLIANSSQFQWRIRGRILITNSSVRSDAWAFYSNNRFGQCVYLPGKFRSCYVYNRLAFLRAPRQPRLVGNIDVRI